ncbi:MAG: Gram-negative bacterial TonB protein C-terminal [Gammaproteobacteria bacterium]|nr:Gram-negative bacterial TonB protein C-terminal [Gammaproteobacteria bacterium]
MLAATEGIAAKCAGRVVPAVQEECGISFEVPKSGPGCGSFARRVCSLAFWFVRRLRFRIERQGWMSDRPLWLNIGLVLILSVVGAPCDAQVQGGTVGSQISVPTPDVRSPRPGPNFPTLESYYPLEARRAGQEGAVVVRSCVDTEGRLTALPSIVTTSGNDVLDAAALRLANAGSGLYLPGTVKGVPTAACVVFKVKFELHDSVAPPFSVDSQLPIISARVRSLSSEYRSRMSNVEKVLEAPNTLMLDPQDPATVRAIRGYARGLDTVLDQTVGLMADLLDDIEYLGKNPDIPEHERTVFVAVWPDQRAGMARNLRLVIGDSRDVVRSMDEMADYLSFSAPRRRNPDAAAGATPTPAEDPQIEQIRQRASKAIRNLQESINLLSGGRGGGQ